MLGSESEFQANEAETDVGVAGVEGGGIRVKVTGMEIVIPPPEIVAVAL